jgi:hypothetical protein
MFVVLKRARYGCMLGRIAYIEMDLNSRCYVKWLGLARFRFVSAIKTGTVHKDLCTSKIISL